MCPHPGSQAIFIKWVGHRPWSWNSSGPALGDGGGAGLGRLKRDSLQPHAGELGEGTTLPAEQSRGWDSTRITTLHEAINTTPDATSLPDSTSWGRGATRPSGSTSDPQCPAWGLAWKK